MSADLAIIVEGQGDAAALPVLVRRISGETFGVYDVKLHPNPFRVPRARFHERFDDFEKAVGFLAISADAILVVLDSDDDDHDSLRENLERRAQSRAPGVEIYVCPAVREFEAWFLASLSSLAGRSGVSVNSVSRADCEVPRDAKGRFRDTLESGVYSETVDQPRFTAIMNLDEARRHSASFSALSIAIGQLLGQP